MENWLDEFEDEFNECLGHEDEIFEIRKRIKSEQKEQEA